MTFLETTMSRMAKMSKKEKAVNEAASMSKRKGSPIHAWIDSALREALDAMIEDHRPKGTLTGHLESAIEQYLEKHGYWPPHEK